MNIVHSEGKKEIILKNAVDPHLNFVYDITIKCTARTTHQSQIIDQNIDPYIMI